MRTLSPFLLCLLATAPAGFPAGPPSPGKGDVYVVPFSHLDLYWAGTREECLSRGNRIITKAIQTARKNPDYRFLIEDLVWAQNYAETHRGLPELDELKRLVKAGRVEVGPKWAGIFQNLPRGEAQVRNHLYGKRYARELFGVDPEVSHLGDLPGYTSQYPQVLAKTGIPYMVMTRMGPPATALFRWKAPEGSKALVWYSHKGYGWGVGLGLHRDLDQPRFDRIARELKEVQETVNGPIYLGWGTDMFSPSEKVGENIPVLNKTLAPWRFRLATPVEYFRAASKLPGIPETSGEIPSSWANLLTSLARLWHPTVTATDTLVNAEKFAAINFAAGYADYPQQEFESLWKRLLESMDHNNFGQGGLIGDARKIEYAETATLRGGAILRDMLRNIAERVKIPFERSVPIVVFNSQSWTRDDAVTTHASIYGDVSPGDIADYRKGMRLVDESGAPVPFHLLQTATMVSDAVDIAFVARGVPPLGYKTYFLVPSDKPESFPDTSTVKLDDPNPARPKPVLAQDEFENGFYRVTVDRATGGVTIFDKELNRVVVRDAAVAATEERGGNTLSIEPKTGRDLLFTPSRVQAEENNPVRTIVRIEGDVAGVPIVERLFLYAALKKIDFETTVEWKPGRLMRLERRFPYEQKDAQVRYGIPFGSSGQADILPNSGPHLRDEVPKEEWQTWRQIQDWMFVGNASEGFTLSADRQLIFLAPGAIHAGMLRGTYSSQQFVRDGERRLFPMPQAGTYNFRYSFTSGKGDWAAARSYRAGAAFANPLIPVTTVNELTARQLPPTHSFCRLEAGNLVVGSIKKAEQDGSIVVRVHEMDGAAARTPVEFLGAKRNFQPVNMLEEAGQGDRQILDLQPYEIGTIQIRVK